jgi:hypothetical protein
MTFFCAISQYAVSATVTRSGFRRLAKRSKIPAFRDGRRNPSLFVRFSGENSLL